MTPAEFKAWFDGICTGIGEVPTKAQWDLILQKVKEINKSALPPSLTGIQRSIPNNRPSYLGTPPDYLTRGLSAAAECSALQTIGFVQ